MESLTKNGWFVVCTLLQVCLYSGPLFSRSQVAWRWWSRLNNGEAENHIMHVVQTFCFVPNLEKWSNLTSIFFRWVAKNHQLPRNNLLGWSLFVKCRDSNLRVEKKALLTGMIIQETNLFGRDLDDPWPAVSLLEAIIFMYPPYMFDPSFQGNLLAGIIGILQASPKTLKLILTFPPTETGESGHFNKLFETVFLFQNRFVPSNLWLFQIVKHHMKYIWYRVQKSNSFSGLPRCLCLILYQAAKKLLRPSWYQIVFFWLVNWINIVVDSMILFLF